LATISKMRRLVNPGKRKLSPLQKLFFGSKRQRAAVARKRSVGKRRAFRRGGAEQKRIDKYFGKSATKRRKRNVGSIVTVWPAGHANPGRRRNGEAKNRLVIVNSGARMAKGSGRVISGYGSTVMNRGRRKKVARRRRRSNPWPFAKRKRGRRKSVRVRARRAYGRAKRAVGRVYHRTARRFGVVRHRRRKSNPGRRHYRRNPSFLQGTSGRIVGVLGGVAVTKLLMGFVPATFTSGVMGYLATGVVAVAQGKLIGKVSKNHQLGDDFMVGGLAYLVARVLNDFFPTVGAYTGISGMGLIGGSNFYVPQVNQAGSMGNFLVPNAVMASGGMVSPANAGVGRLRRTGRLM
jgi:hypothetical protein